MKHNRLFLLLLCVLLCMAFLPGQAEKNITETRTGTLSFGDYDSAEALDGFGYKMMYGSASTWGVSARRMLSDPMKGLYDLIKPEIQAIANGNRSSTQFSYDYDTLTALGMTLSFTYTSEEDRAAQYDALCNNIASEIAALFSALKADCPYDFYWMNYTNFFSWQISCSYGGGKLTIPSVYINIGVNPAFQGSNAYSVSPAAATAARNASAKAKSIVAAAAGKSDYEKLVYYADQIMALTAYNDEAAADQNFANANSNPWQLIYVFDGDPDTNVVCEGYAKAFMYLCDLTTFNSDMVCCITVSGLMSGGTGEGPHMWEVVRMEDGWNYLVDVTNSEFGTVGQNGEFILGGTAGSGDTYIFDTIGTAFTYDSDQPYSEDDLVLAPGKYRPVYAAGDLTGEVKSTEVLAVLADQTVPEGGSLINNGYLHFVNGHTLTVNGTFTNNNAIFVGDTRHTCSLSQTVTQLDAAHAHYATHHLTGTGCTVSGCPIVYAANATEEAHVFQNSVCACGYTQPQPVTITAKDAEHTYDGSPFDVSALFTVDANAGAASYAVISGDAALSGNQLTVQKAGAIAIRIQTAANAAYMAGEATATLTVLKGTPAVDAPAGLTATCGDTLADVALPAAENGTWAWENAALALDEAGEQAYAACFTPTDTGLWNPLTLNLTITVAPAPVPATPGDVNDNGTVDVKDALLLLRYVQGSSVELNLEGADVNADGSVNGEDGKILLQYLAERGVTLK